MNPSEVQQSGTASPSSCGQELSPKVDDPRVTQALEEYLAELEAGQKPDRQQFQARYPEIAEALAECLAGLDFVQAATPELEEPDGDASGAATAAFTVIEAEGPLGDFRIVREIGRGGMGVVYEAVQISLGRRVALKVLPFAAAMDAKQLQRFKNEAQAAAHLHHTNIVPVHAVGCERGVHFYAMQYIEGQTLAEVISELRAGERGGVRTPRLGALTPPRSPQEALTPPVAALSTEHSTTSPAFFRTVARLGVQAAEALEHAHQLGVIHRDIKPANLLVDDGGRLWITDFGLAHCQSQPGLTMTGDVVGTLRYMSPEQALAKRVTLDARTDVYSLGATLYELLTLQPAYNGRNREEVLRQIVFEEPRLPSRLNKAVPAELETIVLKAMAKSTEERYATAQEFADDLERYLKDEPIRARRPTLVQRIKKWTRRHLPVVWTAGLALVAMLVLAVIGLAASTFLVMREKSQTEREKAQTDAAKNELERTLYYKNIQLAEREWSVNNLGRMEQLLEECPADLRSWEWHYLKRLQHKTRSPLFHDSIVLCIAYSPTGQYLASGSRDGVIKLWVAHTGQPFRTFRAGEKRVSGVAFSPDGKRLASAGSDGWVKIWDIQADQKLLDWKAHSGSVNSVVFNPDGQRLATGSADHTVKVWDSASGQELRNFAGHANLFHRPGLFHSLAFSPDGRRLASAGHDRTVRIWEVSTGRELLTCVGHTAPVLAVAFSPDSRSLASASGDWSKLAHSEIKLWDALTGEPRLTLQGHIGFILSVAFSPDGQRLASAGMDKTVKLWDVATGRETLTLRGHGHTIRAVAFSPVGRQLASTSADRTVRIWDATPWEEKPGEQPLTLHVHPAGVLGVAFHPDGQRLASVADDGAVKLWDSQTGNELFTLPDSQGFWSIAFSSDGQRLAASGRRSEMKVWDVHTG